MPRQFKFPLHLLGLRCDMYSKWKSSYIYLRVYYQL